MPDIQCLNCGLAIYLDDTTYSDYQGRVVCPECKGYQEVVIKRKHLVTSNQLPDIYEPIRDILVWEIPEDALLDLAEAAVDLGVSAYKSCVVMCRRCVQRVFLDNGIKDDPNMVNMIEEAFQKGVITEELQQTANAVRFFAVTGAHPKDPLLRNVNKLRASLAIEVTKEILQSIYPLRPQESEQLALEEQSEPGSNEQSPS